ERSARTADGRRRKRSDTERIHGNAHAHAFRKRARTKDRPFPSSGSVSVSVDPFRSFPASGFAAPGYFGERTPAFGEVIEVLGLFGRVDSIVSGGMKASFFSQTLFAASAPKSKPRRPSNVVRANCTRARKRSAASSPGSRGWSYPGGPALASTIETRETLPSAPIQTRGVTLPSERTSRLIATG